jgi:hypothetical protein
MKCVLFMMRLAEVKFGIPTSVLLSSFLYCKIAAGSKQEMYKYTLDKNDRTVGVRRLLCETPFHISSVLCWRLMYFGKVVQ